MERSLCPELQLRHIPLVSYSSFICALILAWICTCLPNSAFAQAEINYSKTAIVKRLTDFGAKPNDSIDDSEAWQKACAWFSNSANINYTTSYGKLVIPSGTFIIGKQKIISAANDPNGYAQPQYPVRIKNVDGLIIEGETGARLKLADNLLFGHFDRSGNPINTENFANQAYTGEVMLIEGTAKNVLIQNLEIDGNSDKYKLGGHTGTSDGYQCISYGIYNDWAQFVTLKNLYIHKFGADGIYVILPTTSTTASDGTERWNMLIDNVRSDSSGRNCFTWTQGINLKVTNSKFRYAAGAKATSAPYACLDIETDVGPISNGLFENCTIQTSYSNSPLNIGGYRKNDNITFRSCIINSDKLAPAIQTSFSKSRVYNFEGCTISGSILTKRLENDFAYFDNNGRTAFKNCTISQVTPNALWGSMAIINDLCLFDNCTFNTKNFSFFNVGPFNATSIPVSNYTIVRNCKFITDKSTDNSYVDWGYAQYLRFEGNNTFSLTSNSISQSTHSRRHFHNNIIAGTTANDQRDVFTIDPFTFTQEYEGTSLTLGADEHSKVDFVITDKSIYDDFKKELIVNKNARIIVKAGGTLLFRSADVKLFGQIIVESGGFLFVDDKTVIKTCSGVNDNNIIMNGSYGVGYNLWKPENPKTNPLAISGSLPNCSTNNFVANVTTCVNLGDVCSSSSTDVKSVTFSVNAAGNYSFKLKEKVSSGQIKINNNAWNTYNPTQQGVNDFKEVSLGNYVLSSGNNTIQLSSSNGPVCYRELCATSISSTGGRVAATETASSNLTVNPTLVVFPNPNQGEFEVKFDLEDGKSATLNVIDITGVSLYSQKVIGGGQHIEKIALPQRTNGSLLVQLIKENNIETQRLVVSR